MFELPQATIDAMRDAARDAGLSAAKAFGFGGETWAVARPVGSGVGTRTVTALGTSTLLVFRQKPGGQGTVAGGTPILADVWRFIQLVPPDGETLKVNDVIVSAADAGYVFAIATIEPWYEYRLGELARLHGPVTVSP